MFNQKSYMSGFTLMEMLVVLTMVGILAAIAIPSFSQQIKQGRVTTAANQLQSVFKFARSEAAKRDTSIVLKATDETWTVKMGAEVLSVFTPDHDELVITGLKDLTISSTGSASSEEEFKIEGENSNTGTYYLCIYVSGQSKLSKGVACS